MLVGFIALAGDFRYVESPNNPRPPFENMLLGHDAIEYIDELSVTHECIQRG